FLRAKMQAGHKISLAWSASKSLDVVKYRLYRADESGEDTLLAEIPFYNQRYYRDVQVDFGHKFVYSIAAVDALGNESLSPAADTVFARSLHPPQSVRNVQAVAMGKCVTLAWEKTADSTVVGYRIFKSTIPTGVYEPAGKTEQTKWVD